MEFVDDSDFVELKNATVISVKNDDKKRKKRNPSKGYTPLTEGDAISDGWVSVKGVAKSEPSPRETKEHKKVICRNIFNGGKCTWKNCPFFHETDSVIIMEECKCSFGRNCTRKCCSFVHETDTWESICKRLGIEGVEPALIVEEKVNVICKNNRESKPCGFGGKCRYIHSYEDAVVHCQCRFGGKCRYTTRIGEFTYTNSGKQVCFHVHENESLASLVKRGVYLI